MNLLELLHIYEISSQKISSYKYKISEYPKLNVFNNFIVYCNARNCLFISGSENAKTKRSNLNINELRSLNEPRTWHNMIIIPNKYIFIVGALLFWICFISRI